MTTLIDSQQEQLTKRVEIDGVLCKMTVTTRFDDRCGNGHNTFSITADITGRRGFDIIDMGGCLHDEIREHFPELAHLIRWHLVSTDGPMHYIANTTYLASGTEWNGEPKTPDIEAARRTAIWPDATLEQLQSKEALTARLDGLLAEFREVVESAGFVW